MLFYSNAFSAALEPVQNERPEAPATRQTESRLSVSCQCFNELNTRIRDGRTAKNKAQAEVKRLLAEVRDAYYQGGGGTYHRSDWVFPLSGHDRRAVGRGRRHGFKPRGYDFFSGNRHGGHPSYDIFIRDRNQDSLDDRSGKAVRVLSMTGGIVVALEKEWEQGSSLRGGRYIWIYDPANELLVYYAHNGELSVELGQIVKPGDLLATVGRSGLNAAKKRSPTHLHLTVLKLKEGRAEPLEVYRDLVRARSVSDN
jgi:murein DD-endopeptidase MepM/ murein hydrolase activator NlpD